MNALTKFRVLSFLKEFFGVKDTVPIIIPVQTPETDFFDRRTETPVPVFVCTPKPPVARVGKQELLQTVRVSPKKVRFATRRGSWMSARIVGFDEGEVILRRPKYMRGPTFRRFVG